MANNPETKGSGERNPPRFPFVRMLLFGFLVLIGNSPFWFFPEPTIPFQKFMVTIMGGLLQASGLQVGHNDLYITLKNGEWVMTAECTVLSAMIGFVAFSGSHAPQGSEDSGGTHPGLRCRLS